MAGKVRTISDAQKLAAFTEMPDHALCFHGIDVQTHAPVGNERHPSFVVQIVGHMVFCTDDEAADQAITDSLPDEVQDTEVVTFRFVVSAPQAAEIVTAFQTGYTEYVQSEDPIQRMFRILFGGK